MQIDKNIKSQLLSLDDTALKSIVSSVARSAGVSTDNIKITDKDIEKIRSAINRATDKDAEEAIKFLGGADEAAKIVDKIKNNPRG